MTVYLKPGMAFDPPKRNLEKIRKGRSLSMKINLDQSSKRQILRTFVISSLIILNIGLTTIAIGWYLLVFSIFHPAEIVEMYSFQSSNTLVLEEAEYTLEIVEIPPPPPFTPEDTSD